MRFAFVFLTSALFVSAASYADWRQFRGNDTTGVAADADVPTSWNDSEDERSNIAWKIPLPGRGLSSPIIVGDNVIVTASSGYSQDRLHILCFDNASGEVRWHRQFQATGNTVSHNKTCNAAPTPACDGNRVFASFSSNDVICLDLDGNLQWLRGLTYDYPNASNSLGMASSPIVIGETLIVQVENDSQSLATGLDVATGTSRWVSDRPKRANWTSPVMVDAGTDTPLALLQSSAGISAVAPFTGEVIWEFSDGASTIPSSAVAGNLVVIPSNGLTTLRLTSGSSNPEQLWNNAALSPSTPSPIAFDGRIYSVNRAGVLACADLVDGSRLWQLRLKGPFSGTPVIAGDRMYLFNEDGLGQVVRLTDAEGEIISSNALHETILSTPAVSDNALFIRSDKHLWKIASTPAP